MSRPIEPVPTPSVVTGIAAGRPVDAVWVCRLGCAGGDGCFHTAGLRGTSPVDPRYNYGGDWRDEFFDAYGVAPDQHRMDHYLRLWEDGD